MKLAKRGSHGAKDINEMKSLSLNKRKHLLCLEGYNTLNPPFLVGSAHHG